MDLFSGWFEIPACLRRCSIDLYQLGIDWLEYDALTNGFGVYTTFMHVGQTGEINGSSFIPRNGTIIGAQGKLTDGNLAGAWSEMLSIIQLICFNI